MQTIKQKLEFLDVHKILYLVFFGLLLVGCASPAAYNEPITNFQKASTVVIEGARIEYANSNKREREALIDKLVANKSMIDLRFLDSKEIRLFGADDLAARMGALDTLTKHGKLLLTLASSDAPSKANDAANSLDDAIIGLRTSVTKLPVSDELTKRAEGFANLAGEVTKLVLEAKIREALDKAIFLSEKNVQALIRLLRNDMGLLYQRQRTYLSAARVMATDEYNDEVKRANPNVERLKKTASEIKKIEEDWDNLLLLLGTGPGLDAMAKAHQELVDYAKSSKNSQDFAHLVEVMNDFVTHAKVIADAIKTIQNKKE